jgi:hypothetical protein
MWKQHLAMGTVLVGSIWGLLNLTRIDRVDLSEPSGDIAPDLQRSIRETAKAVDALFELHWTNEGLEVAPPAPPLMVIRRLSLGLAGTLPSLEELRSLEGIPQNQQIDRWLGRLLQDRRYSDFVAERFARTFVGADNGPFIVFRRRRFTHWLSDELIQNRPYDAMVRQMISGQGTWTSNPSVNFITATFDQEAKAPDTMRLAGRTSRAFLGLRIDCVQCHDDFMGTVELGSADKRRRGEQRDFHQLAAFFSGTNVSVVGIRDQFKPYSIQLLGDEVETKLVPQVPFLAELLPSDGSRRERLAAWVTSPENRAFARVSVNRVWALMFGKPLVEPIDSIPLYEEVPPGLDLLADDFAKHGFDIQRLIRVIAQTRVFQLDSQADFEILAKHETSWSVFPMTRLRPEQVAGALAQGCSVATIDADAHIVSQLRKYFQTSEFVKRYGDVGEDEFDERGISIPQRLLLMNGDVVKGRTGNNLLFNASSQIAAFAGSDREAIEAGYMACFARQPTPAESAHFKERLSDTKGGLRMDALEDFFWVLLNSTEFSWNH